MYLLLSLSFSTFGNAAPWPVELPQSLPRPPAQVAIYRVVPTDPYMGMAAIQDVVGLFGQSEWRDEFGGNVHLQDDGHFAYAFVDGGIDYLDDTRFALDVPIQPRLPDALWADADVLLAGLGRSEPVGFDLQPGNVGRAEATIVDAAGRTHGPWLTAQSVSYAYLLDGFAVFGPGSESTVQFDGQGVVAFSDAQRELDIAELAVPDSPRRALARWLERADREHRWSMYRAYIHDIQRVKIDRVEFGYYAPSVGADAPTIEPVYQITGVMLGHDEQGQAVAVELLWWEPACSGRAIPELNLSSNR